MLLPARRFTSLCGLTFLVSVVACVGGATPSGFSGGTSGGGVGDACDPGNTCRAGLKCDAGKCAPGGATADGAPCSIGDECTSGQCGATRTCSAAGSGGSGAPCGGDADCGKGLRCGFDGASFFPKCLPEGSADVGKTCTASKDCFQGLVCAGGSCRDFAQPPGVDPGPKGIPPYVPSPTDKPWAGAVCKAPLKTGTATALWRLPGASGKADDDFFSVPFPNDALRKGGKVSLATFPHDPKPPMGFDAVKRYLDVLEAEPFGAYSTVYFRFDAEFDFASVTLAGDDPEIRLVDLTGAPADATFGQRRGMSIYYTGGTISPNKYICPNWLAARPNDGEPFKPGGRYAVVVKKGIKTKSDASLARQDADLGALLGSAAPSGALGDAYASYQPLRDYLAKQKIDPADVTTATVFTVGDPPAAAKRVAASVQAAPAPKLSPWTVCKPGVKSPCPQADGERGCGAENPAFTELHAMIDVPIFQKGTAPYAASGGEIDLTGDPSTPLTPVRTEKVCAALTVPKSAAPAGGWPIVVYAHGTGGSFRSHATDGTAAMLSSIDLGGGTKAGFAVLGIDQIGHGPRRCGGADCTSTANPNDVVFNFANPQAARFNYVQGASDQHAVVRAAGALTTVDIGGAPTALDGAHVLFWGHSQGATEGALFLAEDAKVQGAILSGEGGGLIAALTTKTNPVDIKDVLWIALSENAPKAVDGWHPVLSLLQQWVDPSDPIHFAALDVAPAVDPAFPRNVFQPSGTKDTYTPAAVQIPFAVAGGFAFVDPILDAKPATVPSAAGNVTVGAATATAAIRQYTPGSYDGHFVAFKNDQAKADVSKFLARVAAGAVPKVPE